MYRTCTYSNLSIYFAGLICHRFARKLIFAGDFKPQLDVANTKILDEQLSKLNDFQDSKLTEHLHDVRKNIWDTVNGPRAEYRAIKKWQSYDRVLKRTVYFVYDKDGEKVKDSAGKPKTYQGRKVGNIIGKLGDFEPF